MPHFLGTLLLRVRVDHFAPRFGVGIRFNSQNIAHICTVTKAAAMAFHWSRSSFHACLRRALPETTFAHAIKRTSHQFKQFELVVLVDATTRLVLPMRLSTPTPHKAVALPKTSPAFGALADRVNSVNDAHSSFVLPRASAASLASSRIDSIRSSRSRSRFGSA
jgi:hypothetical protein